MRLRRSTPYGPGLRRIGRGRGFSYLTAEGEPVSDREELERIRALVIPPAWRKVWICPYPNGHIQAVGVDAAGRRQYLYHEQWRRERDEEKFDRVLELAARLPQLRERLGADLDRRGLDRHRLEALAIGLLDRGVFRIGGEEYAEENGTRGVATLLKENVELHGDELVFDFTAKGGIRRQARLRDARLAKVVQTVRRSRTPSKRLLTYRDKTGYGELHADDINARFRELTECECSAKDLRTWQGTVLAAVGFGQADPPSSQRGRKRVERAVTERVAAELGNTPAVARSAYIDPRVVEAFEDGVTISDALRRAARRESEDERRELTERAVIRLLRRRAG
ncbi:DNA topoisomerase IB [Nocardia sp. NPDC050713]|uniref:DNA topoisomerase IB n=1 Tax=unclassified Nocardia TaxID=2637762 RepID=UPI0033B811E6